jgi:endogenous inhibitor of DNA gyrase (YacG/DUF329 family)
MSPQLRVLPTDVAVLCPTCASSVPLVLYLNALGPKRQVECPHCQRDVVLHDSW